MTSAVNNISVRVYWANAALGLAWPASYSVLGGFGLASLAGGAVQVQAVPWTVPNITGHFCLLARANAPQDPIGSGPDTFPPLVDETQNNNNIAQRNTNIVDYPEISACGLYTTTVYTDVVFFDALNTWNTTATVGIQFDSADFPLGTGKLIVGPGALLGRWASLTSFTQVGETLIATGFPASLNDIPMLAHETAAITLTIAAEIDERFVLDVEQQVGGVVGGGIQYIRDLPRCNTLPLIPKNWSP